MGPLPTCFSDNSNSGSCLVGHGGVWVQVDSKFTQLAWLNTPRKEGGIQGVKIPMVRVVFRATRALPCPHSMHVSAARLLSDRMQREYGLSVGYGISLDMGSEPCQDAQARGRNGGAQSNCGVVLRIAAHE